MSLKIIVSDTSAISNLFTINQIAILKSLYAHIIIPAAVYDELLRSKLHDFKTFVQQNNSWIEIKNVSDKNNVMQLRNTLDAGESEAIVLAKEIKADLLIIDENMGRKAAAVAGIKTIGLLGILLLAKKKNLIAELKPVLDLLITKSGFRVKDDLYKRVLKEAGE